MSQKHASVKDPCGEFGPIQRNALLWFFAVLCIGLGLVYTLRNTDYYNYMTNGEFFDYAAYRSNRVGQAYIASDGVDKRSHGDYSTAVKQLGE